MRVAAPVCVGTRSVLIHFLSASSHELARASFLFMEKVMIRVVWASARLHNRRPDASPFFFLNDFKSAAD